MEDRAWKLIKVGKTGSLISHLCFADDMLLFIKATTEQVQVVNQCLQTCCVSSGQKVSITKTCIFFTKNVLEAIVAGLSALSGYTKTKNLGMYLGVPLLQQ